MPCGSSSERELEVDGQNEQIALIYKPGAVDQHVLLRYPAPDEAAPEAIVRLEEKLLHEFPVELKRQLGMSGLSLSITQEQELQVSTTVYGVHTDAESIIQPITEILAASGIRPPFGHPATHIYEVVDAID